MTKDNVQEPIKGAVLNKSGGVTLCQNGHEESTFGFAGRLFADPPASQRQWVGLTPDEYRQLEKETTVNGYNGDYCPAWDLIEAVEAKLKEKNA